MEIDKALATAEKYSREYILYLLAFFRAKREPLVTESEAVEGKIVLYAIISASIGLFLQFKFVSGVTLAMDVFWVQLFVKFAYWLSIALLLHSALLLLRARTEFLVSLLTTLMVMPAAYALAGYGAYVFNGLSWLWTETSRPASVADVVAGTDVAHSSDAYMAAIVIQLTIVVLYFPRMLARIPGLAGWRTAIASTIVLAFILTVQLSTLIQVKGVGEAAS